MGLRFYRVESASNAPLHVDTLCNLKTFSYADGCEFVALESLRDVTLNLTFAYLLGCCYLFDRHLRPGPFHKCSNFSGVPHTRNEAVMILALLVNVGPNRNELANVYAVRWIRGFPWIWVVRKFDQPVRKVLHRNLHDGLSICVNR